MKTGFSRRDFLKAGGLALLGTTSVAAIAQANHSDAHPLTHNHSANLTPTPPHGGHDGNLPGTVGEVDHDRNGFDPTNLLTDFDYGKASKLPNGQTLREFNVIALNKSIEIVPGIQFPAWTYNGRIPGPTFRCTEGDRIRFQPANKTMAPIYVHKSEFRSTMILGLVVGVYRKMIGTRA